MTGADPFDMKTSYDFQLNSDRTSRAVAMALAATSCLFLAGCPGGGGGSVGVSNSPSFTDPASTGGLSLSLSTINTKNSLTWFADSTGAVHLTTNVITMSGTCSRGISHVRLKSWSTGGEPSTYDAESAACDGNGDWTLAKTVATNSNENGELWDLKLFGAAGTTDDVTYLGVNKSVQIVVDTNAPLEPVLTGVQMHTSSAYSGAAACTLITAGNYVCSDQFIEVVGSWNLSSDSFELVVEQPSSAQISYPTATTFSLRFAADSGLNSALIKARDRAGNTSPAGLAVNVTFKTSLQNVFGQIAPVTNTSGTSAIAAPVCSGLNCVAPASLSVVSFNTMATTDYTSASTKNLFNVSTMSSESP
ncbi:MAG: hypothetical protein ACK5P7_09230 [Bdellovibrio sp.]|jgi:hypothetical protein